MVVASNRAAAGVYDDTTGPLIVEALRADGWEVDEPVVVPDGEAVGDALRAAVAAGARVVLTTGGTGLTPDRPHPRGDPRAARPRGAGHRGGHPCPRRRAKGIATAALSRGVAGTVGDTLVVNLPGSRGGVKDGLAVVVPLLRHAAEQIDRERPLSPGWPAVLESRGVRLRPITRADRHHLAARAPRQHAVAEPLGRHRARPLGWDAPSRAATAPWCARCGTRRGPGGSCPSSSSTRAASSASSR